MMFRKLGLAALCGAVIVTGPACAMSYAKLVALQSAFLAMPSPQRDKLILHVTLLHADPAVRTPIHAWVLDGDRRLDVGLLASGDLPDVPNPDWIRRDLQLQTDQPKGSVRINFSVLIRPPGGQRVGVAYLQDGVRQAQAVLIAGARQMGGYLATFTAPKLRVVKVKLQGCCTATASGLDGALPKQDERGDIVVGLALLGSHPEGEIAFSAPIVAIDPDEN